METITAQKSNSAPTKAALRTGRVISGLCILFLLVDSIGKIVKEAHSVEGATALGIPQNVSFGAGITLLICTIVFAIPRTAIFGAILLTGYLGGAMAIMVRADQQVYFAAVFALLVWLGLYLRDSRVRAFLS